MDKKYGAYVCTGCGIGDTLDTEALCEVASSEMNMECKTHQALCSADGRALIESDINDGVNTPSGPIFVSRWSGARVRMLILNVFRKRPPTI